ncbi:Tim17/Tim22/Tim23/Pmp24 family-domain-containing protein [Lineolata rhizophorae]|uniref:Mitochondrial import inner membrane translocase subunit TIM22 n=1 Tax=Lineolata rhizophorae TaxID=578093 RepID=A0A6A6NW43_9PEZI|nr:Tim17/Tim22/Tim23/Pmp24 family-domain-containing protein [Lineolata rhizophorae]
MNVPGMPGALGGAKAGLSDQERQMVKFMESAVESCPFKTVMSGGAGFALGGAFGLFMSSMRYDTPLTPAGNAISQLPMRQQLREGLRDMGRSSLRSARNFGLIGAIFSGTECCIEGFRAKHDLANGVAAGCITGGALAVSGGPQAVGLGCVGFAAFSAAIDWYMRLPEDEVRKPVI